MDAYCKGCIYRRPLGNTGTAYYHLQACCYSIATGRLRGCPAGARCTHKDTKKAPEKHGIQVIGHDKEAQISRQRKYYMKHRAEILARAKAKKGRS
jgi:hypothetical protein